MFFITNIVKFNKFRFFFNLNVDSSNFTNKFILKGSVLSGSFSSLWPTSFGLFACLVLGPWSLVLAPCFFFSPFLGCFLFMKFGRFHQ